MEAATILSSSLQVLDLAGNIYNNHNKIKWLFNYCRKSVKVLIVGESGSGKSQFLSTIQENKEFSESRTLVSKVHLFFLMADEWIFMILQGTKR